MASQAAVDKHRVTAVLVSHNGAVWLPEVVAALTSQTRPIDLITAVDTGSQDASTKLLKSARIPFISADVAISIPPYLLYRKQKFGFGLRGVQYSG